MFGGSDAFAASEIIPLRCFLEASRNRDRNVFRTSTTPCEGSDVLDIMRKVCWWLWWLKCDVGQTGTPVSIMGSRGIRWVNRSFVQPSAAAYFWYYRTWSIPVDSGSTPLKTGCKIGIAGPPSLFDRIVSEPPAVIDYVLGQFTGIVGGEEVGPRICMPLFCMTLNSLDMSHYPSTTEKDGPDEVYLDTGPPTLSSPYPGGCLTMRWPCAPGST